MSFVQQFYDWSLAVDRRAYSGNKFARLVLRASIPFRKRIFVPGTMVTANVWGKRLRISADHHLPYILAHYPKWSQSLVHAALAVNRPKLSIIDVGANIGDSVAILEQALPGACTFLCVEPDQSFADLCAANTSDSRVELVREFITEHGERVTINHTTAGTAGTTQSDSGVQSRRLDEVAADFVARSGLDFIKIDTDGYDFKILRSAAGLMRQYQPALFFELHTAGWLDAGENGAECFRWLMQRGYSHFAIFNNDAYLHAATSNPDQTFCESLWRIGVAHQGGDNLHFDVLATTDPEVRDRAVAINLDRMR